LILDPHKGFLPIQGTAHLESPMGNGALLWRSDDPFTGKLFRYEKSMVPRLTSGAARRGTRKRTLTSMSITR
jgi:hypothetical protein